MVIVLYGSLITIGIVGVIAIISNGHITGLALNVMTSASELPMHKIVLGGILPHGILSFLLSFWLAHWGSMPARNLFVLYLRKVDLDLFLLKHFSAILVRLLFPC